MNSINRLPAETLDAISYFYRDGLNIPLNDPEFNIFNAVLEGIRNKDMPYRIGDFYPKGYFGQECGQREVLGVLYKSIELNSSVCGEDQSSLDVAIYQTLILAEESEESYNSRIAIEKEKSLSRIKELEKEVLKAKTYLEELN
jgi:hypothetical protein